MGSGVSVLKESLIHLLIHLLVRLFMHSTHRVLSATSVTGHVQTAKERDINKVGAGHEN